MLLQRTLVVFDSSDDALKRDPSEVSFAEQTEEFPKYFVEIGQEVWYCSVLHLCYICNRTECHRNGILVELTGTNTETDSFKTLYS